MRSIRGENPVSSPNRRRPGSAQRRRNGGVWPSLAAACGRHERWEAGPGVGLVLVPWGRRRGDIADSATLRDQAACALKRWKGSARVRADPPARGRVLLGPEK